MYMLDTNIVSHIFRKNENSLMRIGAVPTTDICISCITEAELRYGAAKRGNKNLLAAVDAFVGGIAVLPWESRDAEAYGALRASMEKNGRVMGGLDLLIAAHAVSRRKIMVTNDAAFSMVSVLIVEDWTRE